MTDFDPVDYTQVPRLVEKEFKGKFPNVGNKVWLQAIVSLISTNNVEYEFGYEDISADEINSRFDFVLMPLANCFHAGWIQWMKTRTEKSSKLRFLLWCSSE